MREDGRRDGAAALSRREFFKSSGGAAALLLWGCGSDEPLALEGGRLAGTGLPDPFARGRFLGELPFSGEGIFPSGVRRKGGLDGRYALDLSKLDSLTVANEDFFIRTFPPAQLPPAEGWTVRVRGLVRRPADIGIDRIRSWARPLGKTLMECAGNGPPVHYGLISSAEWTGVPFAELLSLAEIEPAAGRVLISGFDGNPPRSKTSAPGAAWVFGVDELTEAGAFLAVGMNGGPLSVDHGAPVRLMVPGWYGCVCVKWLDGIEFVGDGQPATSQMREFALRTHQKGVPGLARDYLPAVVDRTAAPVRAERWRLDGEEELRVVGLTWGASVSPGRLGVSFASEEPLQPVSACPPLTGADWAFWSHRWKPPQQGIHRIRLGLLDSDAPARRLEMPVYGRKVEVPALA